MALPAKLRQTALKTLGRDRLLDLAHWNGVEAADNKSKSATVRALVRSRRLDFGSLLAELSRDELKGICRALDLEDSGAEKAAFVARIVAAGERPVDEKPARGSTRERAILRAAELLVAESTCCDASFACRAIRADVARVAVCALEWEGSRRLGLRAMQKSTLREPLIGEIAARALDTELGSKWLGVLVAWFDEAEADPGAMTFLVNRFLDKLPSMPRRRCLQVAEELAITSRNVDLIVALLKSTSPVNDGVLRLASALASENSASARRVRSGLAERRRLEFVSVSEEERREAHAKLFDAIKRRDRPTITALLLRQPNLHQPGRENLSPIEYMRKHRPKLADLFQ